MTVSEFIAWLYKQDQDATVTCLVHESSGSYYEQGGTCTEDEFIPGYCEYTDFRGNPHVNYSAPYFDRSFLLIGGKS